MKKHFYTLLILFVFIFASCKTSDIQSHDTSNITVPETEITSDKEVVKDSETTDSVEANNESLEKESEKIKGDTQKEIEKEDIETSKDPIEKKETDNVTENKSDNKKDQAVNTEDKKEQSIKEELVTAPESDKNEKPVIKEETSVKKTECDTKKENAPEVKPDTKKEEIVKDDTGAKKEETVKTEPVHKEDNLIKNESEDKKEIKPKEIINLPPAKEPITLLFGGDVMAHTENYKISSYSKIWAAVTDIIHDSDLAFANIESPIDTTKKASTYPNFNMTRNYVKAVIDAGFNVFSLCNNHTNDQYLTGMKETVKTMNSLKAEAKKNNIDIYFSGIKEGANSFLTYNVIEKKGWKILFLPMTEVLNSTNNLGYINYIKPTERDRKAFIKTVSDLKKKINCDLFILSVHANEPEYVRSVKSSQEQYYKDLLDAGVDVVWANHTHLIKDRKVVVDTKTNSDKLIMYANGNVISGQRRDPKLYADWPNGERDNTGDGLLYKVTFAKDGDRTEIRKAEPIFITTYINTAHEFIIKLLDDNFVDYLYDVGRSHWAKYIEKRIRITNGETKDLIEWR